MPGDFRVAAVQHAPVFLDLERTLDKACALIAEAAGQGAQLVVFPEAFVPAYPVWCWSIPAGQTQALRRLYVALHANSVTVPGPAIDRLADAAREAGAAVVIGINERNATGSDSTLYNSIVYIAPDGRLLGRHRKLIPTAGERLVWGWGDGSDLDVHSFPFGRVAGLICWENYMPLARQALASAGVQIYAAPTWDRGEPWLSSMRHIAKELRCLVIGCCQAVRREDVRHPLTEDAYTAALPEWVNPGDSVIVDPDGKLMAGPLHEQQGILYADVDTALLVGPRWQLDIAGHYARPDVFALQVRRASQE